MRNILLISTTWLFLLSCSSDEEVILLPEAQFKVTFEGKSRFIEEIITEVNNPIDFVNQSTNAVRYVWNFGDGNSSYSENPKHSYDISGRFNATLAAYNSSGEVSNYSMIVNIGRRKLNELWLLSSPNSLPENMFFYFGEVDNPDISYVAVFPKGVELPFGGRIIFEPSVILTDKDWFWMLIDNQPSMNDFDENDHLIFGTVINFGQIKGNAYGTEGSFIIDETKNIDGLITNDYTMEVGYTLVY